MKRICVLGSTGSIGTQALELCAALQLPVDALCACKNAERLIEQVHQFSPKYVAVTNEDAANTVRTALSGTPVTVFSGADAAEQLVRETSADLVLNAMSGICGLAPSLVAVRRALTLATANKESIVAAGDKLLCEARRSGAVILPVDSEHSAIFQTLLGEPNNKRFLRRFLLTASGGPFRGIPLDALTGVTPEEAVNHPVWRMGKKVSVDSATLMNKGLELIEACRLFEVPEDSITVVLHPQSIVHSMSEFSDGAILAQLGAPDMHTCIKFALTYPERTEALNKKLSFASLDLHFEETTVGRFPLVDAARQAMRRGGSAPCILNAADEAAVALFLERKISYPEIYTVVLSAMERFPAEDGLDADALVALSFEIRQKILMSR